MPAGKDGVLQTATYAHMERPKRCPISSNPSHEVYWMVACPDFIPLMMTLKVTATKVIEAIKLQKSFL
jgi:hypothetical protein